MGWNGSGTFNRSDGTRSGTQVWQDADAAGVKIRADDHDTHDQDIADGLENTVALDGQTTTTTDNAILRYDSGNTQFEGVNISASQIVGRSATGDTRGMSAATARQQVLGVPAFATAVGTNNESLFWSSSSSSYDSKSAATARSLIGLGTAAPANNQVLAYSSSASMYQQTLIDTANIAANAVTYAKVSFSNDIVAGDIAAGAVGTSEIASGAVGQSEVAASAIGQGELKTAAATETLSSNGQSTRPLAGGEYGFYPNTSFAKSDGGEDAGVMMAEGTGGSTPSESGFNLIVTAQTSSNNARPVVILYMADSDNDASVAAKQRYITASPPYDLGDGQCGLFIEADILSDGTVAGLYVAPDPIWANNGPTNIHSDRTDKKTGKKYKSLRRPAVTMADVDAGRADMADYAAAMREAQVDDVEITNEYKNADMHLIPHSWASPPQGTICLLDPVNTHDLLMLHEAGEDVADLIHKGYVRVGDEVKRKGPPGVTPVSWKWK